MKDKRILFNSLVVALSVLLLFTMSLAYFTDRADTNAIGTAGTLGLSVQNPLDEGKLVTAYDDDTVYPIAVSNTGNKLMDVKIVMEVESNMPIAQGFNFTDFSHRVPCLAVLTPSTGVTVQNAGTENIQFSPTALVPEVSGGKLKYTIDSYTLKGVANPSDGITDVEDFVGDEVKTFVTTGTTNLVLYFPSYESDDFESTTDGAYYRVTLSVYGKQHMNTGDSDWAIVYASTSAQP